MRILLVKPWPRLRSVVGLELLQRLEPIELGYLAAAVPEHEVRIVDLRLARNPRRAMIRALSDMRPDVVGLTAYTHESPQMKELAGIVRRHCPKAKVVVGGHHATVAPADCNIPEIDFIIRGEGCGPFAALIKSLSAGGAGEGIPNALPTGNRFDPGATAEWPQYPDPATMPRPRRDLWDGRDYYCVWVRENAKHLQVLFPRVAMVRTSFGCRMKCTFCIVPLLCNGVHRSRPVSEVVEELAGIEAEHIYFADDENFIDEAYAWQLAEEIARRGLHKHYFGWARATTVIRSPDLLRRWRDIGLDGVFVGFEYTADEQLRQVRKGSTTAANEQAQAMLRDMGIACHIGFMLRPEDDESDFARLGEYVRQLPPAQFSFTVCTPSPGTADYEAMRQRLCVKDAYALHDCMHPLVPTKLPLPRFAELYAKLWSDAARRNPLRMKNRLVRPLELWRVWRAEKRLHGALRELDRDYAG